MADASKDPLDLEAVDREIRINELTERLNELSDGNEATFIAEDCPPELHEAFLRHVLEYETAPTTSSMEQLEESGRRLPPPESMDDAALTAMLWEVIHALAAAGTYLHHTDHLSDRELYEHLWRDSLREQMPLLPRAPGGWEWHIDLIGSGSDEDIEIGLRYYDDEEQRQRWARDFPDFPIPPHEDPPYDRDRLLPQAPPPRAPDVDIDYDLDFEDE